MAGDQIDRKEEAKGEKGAGSEHHSGPAKPVAEIAPETAEAARELELQASRQLFTAGSKSHLETIW